MSKVGSVLGGVNVLVEALLGAIGPGGTLVAYVDWEPGYDHDALDDELAAEGVRQAHGSGGALARNVRTGALARAVGN